MRCSVQAGSLDTKQVPARLDVDMNLNFSVTRFIGPGAKEALRTDSRHLDEQNARPY